MAVILYCCGLANNLNAAQVATISNTLFQANNWKTVSRHTILRIMKENKHLITAPRRGKREFLNSMGMQNKRTGPKWPMLYVTLDGWTVELVYQDYEPGKGTTYDNRLVVVVVLDPCDKYPLGYAIGERETPALIQEACRNAIIHTKELFGEALQPLQVQSDRYAIKKMTPFYQAMAGKYYTPAEAHNAKSKVIEPYFNYLNTNYCQLQCANWSGHNVDAKKENQVNREFLNMNKKNFPDRNGVIKQIDGIIAQERAIKQAKYLAKWVEAPADTKMPVGVADYLMMFGEELGTRTNKITGQGIIKEIDGMERTYDTFDPEFRKNMHLDWKLKGDKDNLTCVLALSPDERLRFVLEEKRVLPMDLYSTTQEDVDSRLRVKKFNKDWMAEITEINGRNADTVRELIADLPVGALDDRAEANLKLMFTNSQGQQKEGIQDAKRLGKAKKQIAIQEAKEVAQDEANWQDKHFAFIDQEVDTAAYQNL